MTTETDFQSAIDANPGDWQTRLVLADWLQDRGDPRAEGYRTLGLLRLVPHGYWRSGPQSRLRPEFAAAWMRVVHSAEVTTYAEHKRAEFRAVDREFPRDARLPRAWWVAVRALPAYGAPPGENTDLQWRLRFARRVDADDAAAWGWRALAKERRAKILARAKVGPSG